VALQAADRADVAGQVDLVVVVRGVLAVVRPIAPSNEAQPDIPMPAERITPSWSAQWHRVMRCN
jgi:hypothetical protein